ncbi:MAG: hypothetical protein AAF799_20690 [Myxococcota bacterium]
MANGPNFFGKSSAYANAKTHVYVTPDGRRIEYVQPRVLPQPDSVPLQGFTRVQDSTAQRLDLVSFQTLGNALLAWRVADANGAMDPFDLVTRVGRTLRVPDPTA